MAFKAVYESADEVPEHLRDEFAEGDDGLYRPQIEAVNGWALEDVTGLKSALSKQTAAARTATMKSKEVEAERDALQGQIETTSKQSDGQDSDVEQRIADVKRQLAETHASELEKANGSTSALRTQLEDALIDSAAIAAITNKDVKGNPKLLLPLVKAQSRLIEGDEGSLRVEIFDGNGPRMNSKADPMSFMDLLTEMRDSNDYAGAFEGTGSSGGGTPSSPTGGGSRPLTADDVAKMSQSDYVKARAEGQIA